MKEVKNLRKIGWILLGLSVVIAIVYFFYEYSVWSEECETATFAFYFPIENTPEILLVKNAQIQEDDITANYRWFDAFAKLRYKAVVLYPDGKTLKGIGITIEDNVITLEDKVLPDRPWVIDSLRQEGNKLLILTKPNLFAIIARAFLLSIISYLILGVITITGIFLGVRIKGKGKIMADVE